MKKLIAMALSFWIFSASAQELVEFENGQVANADDINSNFQQLLTIVTEQQEAIDALRAELEPFYPPSLFSAVAAQIDMPNNFVGFAVPPILWLDARNVDGVKNRSLDSSFITKWLDLSGNLHHVTTAVAERSPRISESVIFDSTDDVLIHDSCIDRD